MRETPAFFAAVATVVAASDSLDSKSPPAPIACTR